MPRLNYDHRLLQRHGPRRRKKRTRIAHRLHVNQNAVRVRIVPEVINQVPPAHVQHRSRGNNRAESHLLLQAPVQNGRLQRSALAQQGHIAGERQVVRECRVERREGIHDSQAIRPYQAHLSAPQLLLYLLFELRSFWTALLEPG